MSLFKNHHDNEEKFELNSERFPALRNAMNAGERLFEYGYEISYNEPVTFDDMSDEAVDGSPETGKRPGEEHEEEPAVSAHDAAVREESEAVLANAQQQTSNMAQAYVEVEYIPRHKRHRMKPLPKKRRDGTYNFERPELPHIPADDRHDDDHIPTLFGNVRLDKDREPEQEKKPEPEQDGERLPTLLEFLSEPVDGEEQPQEPEKAPAVEEESEPSDEVEEAPEEDDGPLPQLFANIRKEYRPSADIVRLANEADELEATRKNDGNAVSATSGDEVSSEQEQYSTPEPNELFDMIGSIAREQVELIRRLRNDKMKEKRTGVPKDPYNMSFNNRPLRTNIDDIPEMPMESIVIETAAQRGMEAEVKLEDAFD